MNNNDHYVGGALGLQNKAAFHSKDNISNSDHNSMKQGYLDMSKKVEMDKVVEDSKRRFL